LYKAVNCNDDGVAFSLNALRKIGNALIKNIKKYFFLQIMYIYCYHLSFNLLKYFEAM